MFDKPQILKEKASAWYTVRLSKGGIIMFRSLERGNCRDWIEHHYSSNEARQNNTDKLAELNALFN